MTDSTAPGIREHSDNRGVWVELWVLDLLDGDYPTAILFSQLLWWHQPAKDGRPRVRHQRDGWGWLLRSDDEWQEECRLTVKQVRRSRSVLASMGLIEHRRFKRDGAPTSAWRPRYEMFAADSVPIRPNPELPSEGQFHGSDPQGVDGSDPSGAVPTALSRIGTDRTKRARRTSTTVPELFEPDEDLRELAVSLGLDPDTETAHWKDHHLAKGDTAVDWRASWRFWVRNTAKFQRNGNVHRPNRDDNLAGVREYARQEGILT